MKRTNIILIIIVGISFASCNPKFYIPNTQNVPLISEKGETNLTLSGNGNQVEFQGAYGLFENIAIKADGGLFIPSNLDNGNGGSGKFLEFGAGYFKPLNNNFVFETYAIFGFGSVENHMPSTIESYPLTKGDISANIMRFGIQPVFGYKTKYFSIAISSRFVNLSYNHIEGDLIVADIPQTTYLKDNSSNFLIEPAITIRGGFEKLKLQVQYGYSLNLSNNNFKQDNSLLTVGLNFNFK
ncbi:MAG: hypothetical protein LHW64_10610 [Candidatus Cloacimonetes bacterium]|nr:hypothetical protein [Candidatus Cloacimonadota bacterium]MDY0230563.1 hypothetical protein [Candidatus Cloacimonadaceae bacterium]